MDPAKFNEFLKRLTPLGVQWGVDWWRITGMVNRIFNDNCVPLIGLRRCSYYSPGCIARQFADCQGVPNNDGIFHVLVFTKRVLGRIHETWLKRMVSKDIRFPWFLHPTSGYKTWLIADIKSIRMEERLPEVQQKEEDQLTTLICPKLYFSALYDSHVFTF